MELFWLSPFQVPGWVGDWWGVCGDLLGRRGAEPGAVARAAGSLRLRHLLGRGDSGELGRPRLRKTKESSKRATSSAVSTKSP